MYKSVISNKTFTSIKHSFFSNKVNKITIRHPHTDTPYLQVMAKLFNEEEDLRLSFLQSIEAEIDSDMLKKDLQYVDSKLRYYRRIAYRDDFYHIMVRKFVTYVYPFQSLKRLLTTHELKTCPVIITLEKDRENIVSDLVVLNTKSGPHLLPGFRDGIVCKMLDIRKARSLLLEPSLSLSSLFNRDEPDFNLVWISPPNVKKYVFGRRPISPPTHPSFREITGDHAHLLEEGSSSGPFAGVVKAERLSASFNSRAQQSPITPLSSSDSLKELEAASEVPGSLGQLARRVLGKAGDFPSSGL